MYGTSHEAIIIFCASMIGIVIPILWIRPLWQNYSVVLLRIGLFFMVVGGLLGLLGPLYIKLTPDNNTLALSIGGMVFLGFGISNIATYWWGDAGYALSLILLAFFLHIIGQHFFTQDPIFLKSTILVLLVVSSSFLIFSIDLRPAKKSKKTNAAKIVTALIGAIFTLIEFTTAVVQLLRK
jgi:hypothetical protein